MWQPHYLLGRDIMTAGAVIAMVAAGLVTVVSPQITEERIDDAIYYVQEKALNPFVKNGIYENMEIIYKAGDQKVVLTAEDVVDWVRYWPDGHWDIDDDKIAGFVSELQDKFDTWNYYKILETTDGRTVRVPPGEYGWRLDRQTEIQEISKMLRRDETTIHDLHFTAEAAEFDNPSRDYGESYVEIDLTAQKLWVYVDGEMVVSSDIVSGMMNTDRQTPEGAYAIYYRQSPAVLKGEGYEEPVSYWMPFNRGIGMHDATWQPSFGGDACYYRGSHGCINLPLDKAEIIFETVRKDFPVLCYY